MTDRKFLIIIILLLTFPALRAGRATDDIFTADQHLLAISHYKNIAETDKNIQELFQQINPQTPTVTPVISQMADNILLEDLKYFATDKWVEVLYFSQPLEKNNDWVYVFHIRDQQEYLSSLLSTGNIRQEQTEEGITRYRRTEGLDSEIYYLASADNNLIMMSTNSAAVKKAMNLYQNTGIDQNGLLNNKESDYTLLIHLNRYFLVNSRDLPQFFNMLQTDILQDLAGATAKSDNLLNTILGSLKESLAGIINEMAILELQAETTGDNIRLKSNIDIQYGGSLHYALSAFESPRKKFQNFIPDNSIIFSEMQLWNEEYIQMLEGIANLANTITGEQIDENTAEKANKILELFQQTEPQQIQQGILKPESRQEFYGPVAVSVITVKDSSRLNELFGMINDLVTTGDFAEFIAEEGLRLTTKVSPLQLPDTENASEIELSLRSTYFKLPEVMGKKQRILSAITGNHLITVIPLAPLTDAQYLDSRPFCLKAINDTIKVIKNPANNFNRQLREAAEANTVDNTIYTVSLNPLYYLQTVMAAEAIWPQPSSPNRLPVPWKEFSRFFSTRQKDKNSIMNFTASSNQTNILFTLTLPKIAIRDLADSLFNISPAVGYEE